MSEMALIAMLFSGILHHFCTATDLQMADFQQESCLQIGKAEKISKETPHRPTAG